MKRYSIDNRRSDCLLKERMIAEAKAASSSQRQRKMFDIAQPTPHFYNFLDVHKDIKQLTSMRELINPNITRAAADAARYLTNLPDFDKLSKQCALISQSINPNITRAAVDAARSLTISADDYKAFKQIDFIRQSVIPDMSVSHAARAIVESQKHFEKYDSFIRTLTAEQEKFQRIRDSFKLIRP